MNWKGYPSFDPKIFPAIHEASGGIPRRVNQIATRLLLMGAVEQRSQIDCAMLTAVIEEMARDNRSDAAREDARPFAKPAADRADSSPASASRETYSPPPPAPAPARNDTRDQAPAQPPRPQQGEIDELRAAIATLSRAIEGSPRTDGNVADRIAALETRLEEQEQSVRYVLQLLIEWLDKEGRPTESRAA